MSAGYYESLDFNSPMTSATADRLVAACADAQPSSILDVGCGWAELLLRLLESCPSARGRGVDHDGPLLARAARNAAERNLQQRVSFEPDLDASTADLVINIGAEHVFGSLADALAALHELVNPGGRLLLGTQVWDQPPSSELLDDFGLLPDLAELVEMGVGAGFRPLGLTHATLADWDEFEFRFLNDWEQVAMTSGDVAEVVDARRAADRHRADYLRRRGVFGFVYLTLGRPIHEVPAD